MHVCACVCLHVFACVCVRKEREGEKERVKNTVHVCMCFITQHMLVYVLYSAKTTRTACMTVWLFSGRLMPLKLPVIMCCTCFGIGLLFVEIIKTTVFGYVCFSGSATAM